MWFLTWTAHMKRTRDYSERQCWAIACQLCPEVFAKADLNTFRKWHPVDWEAGNAATPGRKPKLSPGTVQELQVVVLSLVQRGVPLTLDIVTALVNEQIKPLSVALGIAYMQGLGLTCQSLTSVAQKLKFTQQQILDLQRLTALKLLWLQNFHGIPAWRCYNVDETWMKLLPAPGRAWGYKPGSAEAKEAAPKSEFPKGRSLAATITLAVPVFAPDAPRKLPPLAQVITQGSTDKSTPPRPWPVRVECCATENHWSSQETFYQLLLQIQREIGEGIFWICVLDMAPIHCARPLLDKVAAELPTCKLCFLLPSTTSICQPCDMVMFRPFKAHMTKVWCEAAAREMLHDRDALGRITKPLALRADLPWLVKSAMEAIHTAERSEKGWKHLRFAASEVPLALSQANELHARDVLFSKVVPDPEEDQAAQQTAAEAKAAAEEVVTDEGPEAGDDEPEVPDIPDIAAKSEVPLDSAMQIGKFLALRLVYGSPAASTLEAIADAAKPRAKGKGKGKGSKLGFIFLIRLQADKQTLSIPQAPLRLSLPRPSSYSKHTIAWAYCILLFFCLLFFLGGGKMEKKRP